MNLFGWNDDFQVYPETLRKERDRKRFERNNSSNREYMPRREACIETKTLHPIYYLSLNKHSNLGARVRFVCASRFAVFVISLAQACLNLSHMRSLVLGQGGSDILSHSPSAECSAD